MAQDQKLSVPCRFLLFPWKPGTKLERKKFPIPSFNQKNKIHMSTHGKFPILSFIKNPSNTKTQERRNLFQELLNKKEVNEDLLHLRQHNQDLVESVMDRLKFLKKDDDLSEAIKVVFPFDTVEKKNETGTKSTYKPWINNNLDDSLIVFSDRGLKKGYESTRCAKRLDDYINDDSSFDPENEDKLIQKERY